MNMIDFGIVLLLAVLLGLGLVWGFVKITIALGTWITASFVSFNFGPNLAASLLNSIESDALRLGAAMGLLFVLTIMMGALVSFLVRQIINKTGLSGLDRVLGMLVGGTLGMLIIIALVFIIGLTDIPQLALWQSSILIERFEILAAWLQGYLPADVAKYFSY